MLRSEPGAPDHSARGGRDPRETGIARRQVDARRPRRAAVALAVGLVVMVTGCGTGARRLSTMELNTDGGRDPNSVTLTTGEPSAGPSDGTTPSTSSSPSMRASQAAKKTRSPAASARSRSAAKAPAPAARRTATAKAQADATGTSSGTYAANEAEVLRLVNVERAKAGCPVVTANPILTAVARAHSKDMAVNGYFAHDSQNGATSPFDRMKAAGYTFTTAAENIAAGQATPAAVMTSWMNSAGHRANILDCDLTELGVGEYRLASSPYGVYWTQDFGTPA